MTTVARRLISIFKRNPSQRSAAKQLLEEGDGRTKAWGRRIAGGLICLTGGFALGVLHDLVNYHGCSSKALEKASKNPAIIEAIGEPIVRGPWYNTSLEVTPQMDSVSCTFPVSGPQGTGMFQLKAVRNEGRGWVPDWEILSMEALLHVPSNEANKQTFRISLTDTVPPLACTACTDCKPQQGDDAPETKQSQTS